MATIASDEDLLSLDIKLTFTRREKKGIPHEGKMLHGGQTYPHLAMKFLSTPVDASTLISFTGNAKFSVYFMLVRNRQMVSEVSTIRAHPQ